MFKNVPALQKLIRHLQYVPYLASKNLYRVASHFLSSDEKDVKELCNALLEVKSKVKKCKTCFNWTEENDECYICRSHSRNKNIICVVERWHDLLAIERGEYFSGVYHVLGGSLCPLEGVGPDDLNIEALLKRVKSNNLSSNNLICCEEIILATNPTPEGEATASFIASRLESMGCRDIKVSRLASGVPIGSSLEYMDKVTIHKAITGRQPF